MNIVIRASLVVAAVLSGCGGTTASDNAGGSSNAGGNQQAGSGAAGGSTAGAGGSSATGGAAGSTAAGAGGSSATAGAGGSSATAGAGGSSAAAGAGGSGAGGSYVEPEGGTCSTGTVTFQMKPAAGQTWCGDRCLNESFTIRSLGGEPLSWQMPCFGCQDAACGISALPPDWLTMDWDGAYYVYKNCNAGLAACTVEKHCAPPGKYVATWPGFLRSAVDGGGAGSCSYARPPSATHEVTFDWPATTTFSWVVSEAADGGDGG